MARLFFALWPNDRVRNELYQVASHIDGKELRLVKKANLHMTLEFLGEVGDDDRQELIDKAAMLDQQPFDLQLTRVGFWKKPKILYIGTTQVPAPLLQLVKALRHIVKQQGMKPDAREYRPHVTFARKARRIALPKETFRIDWHADRFALVVSESTEDGVRYSVLESWPLR